MARRAILVTFCAGLMGMLAAGVTGWLLGLMAPSASPAIVSAPVMAGWYVTALALTVVLPSAITAPYDPVGHPLVHLVGFIANAFVLGYLVRLIRRRWRGRRPAPGVAPRTDHDWNPGRAGAVDGH